MALYGAIETPHGTGQSRAYPSRNILLLRPCCLQPPPPSSSVKASSQAILCCFQRCKVGGIDRGPTEPREEGGPSQTSMSHHGQEAAGLQSVTVRRLRETPGKCHFLRGSAPAFVRFRQTWHGLVSQMYFLFMSICVDLRGQTVHIYKWVSW